MRNYIVIIAIASVFGCFEKNDYLECKRYVRAINSDNNGLTSIDDIVCETKDGKALVYKIYSKIRQKELDKLVGVTEENIADTYKKANKECYRKLDIARYKIERITELCSSYDTEFPITCGACREKGMCK